MKQPQVSKLPKWQLKFKYANTGKWAYVKFDEGIFGTTPDKKVKNAEKKIKELSVAFTEAIIVEEFVEGDKGVLFKYDMESKSFYAHSFKNYKPKPVVIHKEMPIMSLKATKWNQWNQLYSVLKGDTIDERLDTAIYRLKKEYPDMRFENCYIYEKTPNRVPHKENLVAEFDKDKNVFVIQDKYRWLIDPKR